MKPALAVDLDDIIYPFVQNLVPTYNEQYGTNFDIENYTTFEFNEVWGTTPREAWDRVHEYFGQLLIAGSFHAPLDGAETAIKELSETFRLYIVTSRADELNEFTTRWVGEHFPATFDGVFLCNSYTKDGRGSKRTKLSVVEELDAVGLIDDSASHITEVVNAGRVGVLFGNYAWNRNAVMPEGTIRAADWPEATSAILKAV